MRVESLRLENFRGIKSLSIDFDPQLNVFAGVNGSGKSTLLDAVAILLSWFVHRLKGPRASGQALKEKDVKNGSSAAEIEINCLYAQRKVSWSLSKKSCKARLKIGQSDLASLNDFLEVRRSEIERSRGEVNLPVLVHYPVQRAVLEIPLRIRTRHTFDLFSAYDEAMMGGANFRVFFEWFRGREDLENEAYRYDVAPSPDSQLEAVRAAIASVIPSLQKLSVRRSPLRMEVEKDGRRLAVGQLSDGEKCLMAMIGDLARRLSIANPAREHPLEGEGIILIDEVDLHLHPSWQAVVVPRLRDTFPNCQFLITTHSPHVLSHVFPRNLFLLFAGSEGIEVERPEASYGKSAEQVLEGLMGMETTRPQEIAEELRTVYDLLDKQNLKEAKEAVSGLVDTIGMDPELLTLRGLIRRKELIGK